MRHGIKHLPKKHLTVPRRDITTKTLNHKEDAKPYTWLYPTDEKFDLERYKDLYLHYQDWEKPSWISHRIYVPNKSTFKPGKIVNVGSNSGIPPGEFDLRPYKKLYREKLAIEKRKLSIFKKKGKLWQKLDKSPVLGKNKKKKVKVINLARSKSMDKDKRDKKMTNAKAKLRARSLSIQIRELNEALTAHGDHILPSETINSHDIFDNVDSEITSIDMMKILTPRRKKSSAKGLVQDELELDLSLTLQSS